MLKKEMASSFLKLTASGNVIEAFDRFIAHDFIHHNQYFKGDRRSLLRAMSEAHNISPNKSIEVKQIFEDGDNVITHSLVLRKNAEQSPITVVHIFKIKDNRIVELWDQGQEIMKESPNENGLF